MFFFCSKRKKPSKICLIIKQRNKALCPPVGKTKQTALNNGAKRFSHKNKDAPNCSQMRLQESIIQKAYILVRPTTELSESLSDRDQM